MPAAWLATEEPGDLVIPELQRSSDRPKPISRKELAESYEFLGSKAGVEVFREKSTGEMLYIGRTQRGVPPSHLSGREIQKRYTALVEELSRLGGMENAPPRDYQGNLSESGCGACTRLPPGRNAPGFASSVPVCGLIAARLRERELSPVGFGPAARAPFFASPACATPRRQAAAIPRRLCRLPARSAAGLA